MTNISAVIAELMEKVEVNSPRIASLHYCLSEAAKRIAELEQKLAASEARCAALAEENAGLKEWSPNPRSASMFEAIEKAEKLMDDGMPELAMVEAFEILKMKRAPATDAFLAEVRASGVEMFAERKNNEMMSLHPDTHAVGSIAAEISSQVKQLREFAAQLRKGVQP